jgi:hypothetical protein
MAEPQCAIGPIDVCINNAPGECQARQNENRSLLLRAAPTKREESLEADFSCASAIVAMGGTTCNNFKSLIFARIVSENLHGNCRIASLPP